MIERSRVRVPAGCSRIIFFSRVSRLCSPLSWYSFYPRVTAVARERSRSFCQNCSRPVTYVFLKWQCKLVHDCMVYTERAPWRQQLHVPRPVMQQPNSAVSTPLRWIFKNAVWKATVNHSKSHAIFSSFLFNLFSLTWVIIRLILH